MTQQSPAASLAVPALGRFGPTAVSVAALAVISMGLMAWSHMGWSRLQHRAHNFDTLLSQTQVQAHEAQWLAEQRVLGQSSVDAAMVSAPAAKALEVANSLREESPAELDVALQNLIARLEQLRQKLDQGMQTPAAMEAAQLRRAITQVDDAARQAAQAWATALSTETAAQQRLDKINMGLVGGITLLLLTLMRRAHRQREQATDALKSREAQLRAFAEVLPDLAFRMDAQGRYLDIYGSNLALLGRPPEGLIGLSLQDFFPAEMAARFMGVQQQAL